MAKTWLSDQMLKIKSIFGTANAGLGGAPDFPRATEIRGIVKVIKFDIEQDTPNPQPGDAAGSVGNADIFIIAELKVTDRIYFGRVYFNAWGSDIAMQVGKIDPNNVTNTDADHYLVATSIVTPGVADINLNIGEQVGDDPKGDQSIGNLPPNYGSQDIQITVSVGGSSFAGGGGTIKGFLLVVEEGN